MVSCLKKIFFIVLIPALITLNWVQIHAESNVLSVSGAVKTPLTLSLPQLKTMHTFHIANVTHLKEKKRTEQEERLGVFNYRGVLLKDLLEKAGMQYTRKWEPGVFIRVIGSGGKEVVFSFGEIFYSSIGRSVLLAYERDGESLTFDDGLGELIVATDLRSGRHMTGVREIRVERVDIKMNVYEENKKNITRPPTSDFILEDKKTGKSMLIGLKDLQEMEVLTVPDVVLTGDCVGFHGVYSFRGVSLRSLLEKLGIDPYKDAYDRFATVSSENGFSATFSFGEIFNSRLSDNIVIAYEKDGKLLDSGEAFAMSAVREDSLGGRSVRRISKIEIQ